VLADCWQLSFSQFLRGPGAPTCGPEFTPPSKPDAIPRGFSGFRPHSRTVRGITSAHQRTRPLSTVHISLAGANMPHPDGTTLRTLSRPPIQLPDEPIINKGFTSTTWLRV
jgi:hypothetical protein